MSDQEGTIPRPKPKRREKGIFGIPKSKNRTFFAPNDEDWSSDDSDEDFQPEPKPQSRAKDNGAEKDRTTDDDDEAENDNPKPRARKKKAKTRKLARIDSDDEIDDGERDVSDSSFAASDSDEESLGDGGGRKKKSGGVGRKKKKTFVDDSDASLEENGRFAKEKRNVTRKSYVENSDDDYEPGAKSRKKTARPSSVNDFVAPEDSDDDDEEFNADTPSGDSGEEMFSRRGKTNKLSATKAKNKKKNKPTSSPGKRRRAKKIDLSSEDDFLDDSDDSNDDYQPNKAKKKKQTKLNSNIGRKKAGTSKTRAKANNGKIGSSSASTKKRCVTHQSGRGGSKNGKNSSSRKLTSSSPRDDTLLTNSNGAEIGSIASRTLTQEELMLGWRWANHLPLHVLVQIFQMVVTTEGSIPFLLHVEQISPSWDTAAQTASLWKCVDLTGGWANLDVRKFTNLCKNQFRHLAELTLPSFALVNEALPLLATHCSSTLVSLGLPGCRKLKETVATQHIPHSFPHLRALDLSDVSEQHRKFFKPVVSAMGDKLVSLNISRNIITGLPALMQTIIANCPSIEFLDMSNIHGNYQQLLKISQFQKACPKLKTLRMAGLNIVATDNQEEISEMRGFPLLEDLSLAQTEDLMSSAHMLNRSYNQTLRLLLASSNALKLLDIRGLRGLTASGLDIALFGPALNTHLTKEPQLQHLFWSGITKCDIPSGCPLGSDMDFRQLITSLRTTLLTLDLSQNIFPSTHLDALCAAFERGRLAGDSGPPLSDLNLATTNVEESHVRRLLASCDNLSSINLSGSRALPRDMKRLYQGDAFVKLKSQLT